MTTWSALTAAFAEASGIVVREMVRWPGTVGCRIYRNGEALWEVDFDDQGMLLAHET